MSKKFIPNGDIDFKTMADCFARNIAQDPGRYAVTREESDTLSAAVAKFGDALQACRSGGERSSTATRVKELARAEAEQIIRRLAHVIRATKTVDPIAKHELGLRERAAKAKVLACPQEPPRLTFVQALHLGSGATPMHELAFTALDRSLAKPAGAVRLELFVDLVPLEEAIPQHPGANHGSRPWYLRSYTKSPIVLAPPLPRVPMRVVYWARWADSTGNTGPFSATVVGWVEGASHTKLAPAIGRHAKPVPILENAAATRSDDRERTYVVAVMEAQYLSMNPQQMEPAALPAPEEEAA